jgi:hypothetical protein
MYSIHFVHLHHSKQEICENSSAGRAQPCQGWGREFESRFSLKKRPIYRSFFIQITPAP